MSAKETYAQFVHRFGDVLRCPGTQTRVELDEAAQALVAADGSRRKVAAIRDGVIDFVSPDTDDRGDKAGFSYQWDKLMRGPLKNAIAYNNTPEDLKRDMLRWIGLPESEWAGKTFLDFGSGHGQYCRVAAKMGATTLGVDLSEVAYRCTREHQESGDQLPITFLRSDALKPAIAPGSFDIVISIGMAMITPDAHGATVNVCRCVKPGGRMLLYIYETGRVGYVNMRYKFPLPTKFPRWLQLLFCRAVAVPLSFYLAGRKGKLPNMRTYHTATLGLLDAYLPKYHSTHEPEEMIAWMQEAGLTSVRRLSSCFFYGERAPEEQVNVRRVSTSTSIGEHSVA